MPVPLTALGPRRDPSSQSRLQLFLDDRLDRLPDPLSHSTFYAVRSEVPGILLHGVILRHPPPSGRLIDSTTKPDDDASSTFPPTSRHYLIVAARETSTSNSA